MDPNFSHAARHVPIGRAYKFVNDNDLPADLFDVFFETSARIIQKCFSSSTIS